VVTPPEECDDGNKVSGDGCSASCAFEATCGNGKVEPGESCDDGNKASGDGCSAACQIEAGSACGDAVNLDDPAKVSVSGNVTTYSGNTAGAGTTFGVPSCSAGTAGVPRVVHRYTVGAKPAALAIETVPVGGALDDTVVNVLSARVVCGAANNQLAHDGIEKQLQDRGILYAPDYMVNAGGLIQVADELKGFSFERARQRAEKIFDTTARVFGLAEAEGVPPAVAADRLAERRMTEVGRLRSIWLP
jgi:cysteine-rich repeat protein